MNHTVKFTIEVSDEQIIDIMSAALQGMHYWADEAEVMGFIKDEDDGMFTSEALTKGYRVKIHDYEEDKYHILTLKKLLNGIALNGDKSFDDFDMYDSEKIVQYALFGKEVYA